MLGCACPAAHQPGQELKMQYSATTVASVAAVLWTAYLVICRVRDYARMRHIPGPFWAHWTDLWLMRAQFSGKLSFILQDLNKKHGA